MELIKNIDKEKALGLFLILVHLSGFIGMLTPARNLFILLTPLNLFFCFSLVFYFHRNKNATFFLYTSVIIVLGFIIELIGVNTGWPFGDYTYGSAFGPQFFGTPLVIGLNWFVLTYCTAMLLHRVTKNKWINAIITGLSVTLIDFILEPIAIQSGYWTWEATTVPMANYITWFLCVVIFARMIYHFEKDYKNSIVPWVLGAQVFFFVALNIANIF